MDRSKRPERPSGCNDAELLRHKRQLDTHGIGHGGELVSVVGGVCGFYPIEHPKLARAKHLLDSDLSYEGLTLIEEVLRESSPSPSTRSLSVALKAQAWVDMGRWRDASVAVAKALDMLSARPTGDAGATQVTAFVAVDTAIQLWLERLIGVPPQSESKFDVPETGALRATLTRSADEGARTRALRLVIDGLEWKTRSGPHPQGLDDDSVSAFERAAFCDADTRHRIGTALLLIDPHRALPVLTRAQTLARALSFSRVERALALELAWTHRILGAHSDASDLLNRYRSRRAPVSTANRTSMAVVGTEPYRVARGRRPVGLLHAARALDFIESCEKRSIRVDDIADHCGIGRRALEIAFRTELDMSVAHALTLSKMNRAALQLTTTPKSIKAIAADVGFESSAAFTRRFREQFRTTPTEYRAASRRDRQTR